ncbi:MAG: ABC transporter substrate-binding protein [Chloroflexi bacterium]|nr:ABC transporter substrate-binding protein [Chloroflexota bacterium]
MPGLPLKTTIGSYGHTRLLKDGSISSEKVAFEWVEISPIINVFRRMVRGLEFDVSEMALSTYLCAKAYGKRMTAIPVFPVRGFHQGAIVYNTRSGIKSPHDLIGRKVGVRAYTVTTGVWLRGILKSVYGVDPDNMTWVLAWDEHVAEYMLPPNVVSAPKGSDLKAMLISGEIDAAIGVGNIDSSHVEPLIPDARKASIEHFQQTGIYPINHTIVIKDELIEANPWLPEELFSLFKAAKDSYIRLLGSGGRLDSADEAIVQMGKIVGGDPLSYGIEPNRKTLEAFIDFNVDQQIIPRKVDVEELFASSTLVLE